MSSSWWTWLWVAARAWVSGGGGSRRTARNPNRLVCRWGAAAHGEPRIVCARPPPLYMALATGAHQPYCGWVPPGREAKGDRAVGHRSTETNLTFSLLISLYSFHHESVH